jgi:hypothetical protein
LRRVEKKGVDIVISLSLLISFGIFLWRRPRPLLRKKAEPL